jgi:uncharacterized tellurite resistance protein B-like protein
VANMLQLRQLLEDVLANGKVEGHELEVLRRELYADGKIDRSEADFLVEMHKRVQRVTPAFEQFFYQAIKDHLLADGKIEAEEVTWLRQMLYADGRIDEQEKKFLRELRGEAQEVSPEFVALCKEALGEK